MAFINPLTDLDQIAKFLQVKMVVKMQDTMFDPSFTIYSGNSALHSSEPTMFTPLLFGFEVYSTYIEYGNNIVQRFKNLLV